MVRFLANCWLSIRNKEASLHPPLLLGRGVNSAVCIQANTLQKHWQQYLRIKGNAFFVGRWYYPLPSPFGEELEGEAIK